jgi:glutamyl/glutaminyl-tRNA synthetase
VISANFSSYRGRIAPSPTGYLHVGHAKTFWVAQQRVREANGVLVLRNENIDCARCKPEFVEAMLLDLRWFGFEWQEGPDVGGPFASYNQSARYSYYRETLAKLEREGFIYRCVCSRKDLQAAARAPHAEDDEEPIYPGTCRDLKLNDDRAGSETGAPVLNRKFCWRFRVPDGEAISFDDGNLGPQRFVAGKDFGDFVVWRADDVPAYQLACVADDAAMEITEVVRGADLLVSTARQLLLYRALGLVAPSFFHCPLVTDAAGVRLAKRHDALSLRQLRARGEAPQGIRRAW